MKAEEQIDKLARFILRNVPGEPSESEGAVDCAIRLIGRMVDEGSPGRCDPRVFSDGTPIAILPAERTVSLMDGLVKLVAAIVADPDFKIDWYYAGGRVIVKAIGAPSDVSKAEALVRTLGQVAEENAS
jgi:hypothetical protein